MKKILLAIAIAAVGWLGWEAYERHEMAVLYPRPTTTPSVDPAVAAYLWKRAVTRDDAEDDGRRRSRFREILSSPPNRCDEVRAATLQSKWMTWLVVCSPGYVYLVTFDGVGEEWKVEKQ